MGLLGRLMGRRDTLAQLATRDRAAFVRKLATSVFVVPAAIEDGDPSADKSRPEEVLDRIRASAEAMASREGTWQPMVVGSRDGASCVPLFTSEERVQQFVSGLRSVDRALVVECYEVTGVQLVTLFADCPGFVVDPGSGDECVLTPADREALARIVAAGAR